MGETLETIFVWSILGAIVYALFFSPFVGKMDSDIDEVFRAREIKDKEGRVVDVIPPARYSNNGGGGNK